MKRDAYIPKVAGAYALAHVPTKQAYVGTAYDLAERASAWKSHLEKAESDPSCRLPVRSLPRFPANQWSYVHQPATDDLSAIDTALVLRTSLAKAGFALIGRTRKSGAMYEVAHPDGPVTLSLADHIRKIHRIVPGDNTEFTKKRFHVAYTQAWKCLQQGLPVEVALGLVERDDAPSRRGVAIAHMPVKIVAPKIFPQGVARPVGSHFTYSEASGYLANLTAAGIAHVKYLSADELRVRMKAFRKSNPQALEVALAVLAAVVPSSSLPDTTPDPDQFPLPLESPPDDVPAQPPEADPDPATAA